MMQPNDLNALAERLREYTEKFAGITVDEMVFVPIDVARAAADALTAMSGTSGSQIAAGGSTHNAPSVAEAREAVERAIDDFGDDRFSDRYGNWDMVTAALDRYAAAVRADSFEIVRKPPTFDMDIIFR